FFVLTIVTDDMLPEPALPNICFSMPLSRPRRVGIAHLAPRLLKRLREQHLHAPDSPGIVGVTIRERPQEVKMVEQNDTSFDVKRALGANGGKRGSQQLHIYPVLENPTALVSND